MANFSTVFGIAVLLLTFGLQTAAGGPVAYATCMATCYTLWYSGMLTVGVVNVCHAGLLTPVVAAAGTALATAGGSYASCAAACVPLTIAPTP
uniref:Uncharacterized protein n=1 Tax=Plectus sambesii TaxID=2011161 RepID=A0A914WBH7_9BILA